MAREVGRPPAYVVLRPLSARWLQRRVSVRELRDAAATARVQGRSDLAEQLEELSAQLRLVASSWDAASANGSAEVVAAEAGSDSERPSSLDTTVVAGLLGVTPRRVRMLCDSGALSATRLARGWVIDRSEVDDYLLRSTE